MEAEAPIMSDKRIRITSGDISVTATLNDSRTAEKVWSMLPIEGRVNTWGDEIYFGIGLRGELEDGASDVVDMGAVGYWPPGDALCLFFGRTPASQGDEIRAASAVNLLGAVEGGPEVLKKVSSGATISVEKA